MKILKKWFKSRKTAARVAYIWNLWVTEVKLEVNWKLNWTHAQQEGSINQLYLSMHLSICSLVHWSVLRFSPKWLISFSCSLNIRFTSAKNWWSSIFLVCLILGKKGLKRTRKWCFLQYLRIFSTRFFLELSQTEKPKNSSFWLIAQNAYGQSDWMIL